MTAKRRFNAQCHDCRIDAICPTCKKPVSPATEFSDWSREQKAIRSSVGFVPTDLDFVWLNYKSKQWMLLEEKRYNARLEMPQRGVFNVLHNSINDKNYKGFYIVRFEKTSPEDGSITIENLSSGKTRKINKKQFFYFLQMNWKHKQKEKDVSKIITNIRNTRL